LGTVDRRAAEDAVRAVAGRRGWAVVAFAAPTLAAQRVPHPSGRAAELAGTASVAEAAALLVAGAGAQFVVAKRVSPDVTVAICRAAPGETSDTWTGSA
jgi:cobalamin biosynthesis protein CbiG